MIGATSSITGPFVQKFGRIFRPAFKIEVVVELAILILSTSATFLVSPSRGISQALSFLSSSGSLVAEV